MNVDKLIKEIKKTVQKNGDWLPLAGALVGYFATANADKRKKIVNALIGGGLGFVATMLLGKDEDDEEEEDNED